MSLQSSSQESGPVLPLPDELLHEFEQHGMTRSFRKNAIVVVEGEPAETLYLVLEGRLLVYVEEESGRVAELSRLGPGQYFGELMLGGHVRSASVMATTNVRLCLVRRAEFENILKRRPDLAFHLIQTLIARVKDLTENVRGLALMDVYGRVARLLLEEAVPGEGGYAAIVGLSQQAMAERIGASRSMINRVLKDLTAGGYIASTRGRIEIRRGLPKRW